MGQQQQQKKQRNNGDGNTKCPEDKGNKQQDDCPVMRVYLAQESCVYIDDVNTLMTKDSNSRTATKTVVDDEQSEGIELLLNSKNHQEKEIKRKISHPLIPSLSDDDVSGHTKPQSEWDSSVLILIPLRLGLESFNESTYGTALAHTFSLPQSVGFVGGYPRH